MSDQRADLPVSDGQSGNHLNIDLEEVWAELEPELGGYEEMLPGDVTLDMICEKFGISREIARRKMAELVKAGRFRRVRVYNANMAVYRIAKS